MPTLKRYHLYKNKNPKKSQYINEFVPIDDREVSKRFFDSFEDVTDKRKENDENPT